MNAGLRLDGAPALAIWDLIVSVLGNTIQTPERPGRPVVIDKSQRSQGMTNVLNNIDCVPSNVQFSHQEALLYVFDNEAVIKMIIKGRSPTMRHVCRTHRVALDWLFDGINLDPKIQIKYIGGDINIELRLPVRTSSGSTALTGTASMDQNAEEVART